MFAEQADHYREPNASRFHPSETPGAGLDPRRVERLAHQFANEPELILASLEAANATDGALDDLPLIWAAALLATRSCPGYADLHYFAAYAAQHTGDLETARDLLNRALELNPRYEAALILAARVAMQQLQPEQALRYLRQALFNGADYPDVHVMMGDLLRALEQIAPARRSYRRALTLNENLESAKRGLAALPPLTQEGGMV